MSGIDLPDGRKLRKGAVEAVIEFVRKADGTIPAGIGEAGRGGLCAGSDTATGL